MCLLITPCSQSLCCFLNHDHRFLCAGIIFSYKATANQGYFVFECNILPTISSTKSYKQVQLLTPVQLRISCDSKKDPCTDCGKCFVTIRHLYLLFRNLRTGGVIRPKTRFRIPLLSSQEMWSQNQSETEFRNA